jgi:methylmalonyl-CoA mutase N-terminal domain/subunit
MGAQRRASGKDQEPSRRRAGSSELLNYFSPKRCQDFVEGTEVRRLLAEVRRVAATKENLMPVLIEAARARCTVGELMNAMADVFGRYDGAARW